MDATLLAAIIGGLGAISGSLITAFVPEIRKVLRLSGGSAKDLLGEWSCDWFVDNDSLAQEPAVRDVVIIEDVSAEEIKAKGISPLMSEYQLHGMLSLSNVVTLTFQATRKRNLTGVVILELNVLRDEMRGYWHQYSPDGKFVGGRTSWAKGKGSIQS